MTHPADKAMEAAAIPSWRKEQLDLGIPPENEREKLYVAYRDILRRQMLRRRFQYAW